MTKPLHPELSDIKRDSERPLTAMFAVTYKCQCKCAHCGSGRLHKPGEKELSTEEARDLLRQVSEAGAEAVTFFGGEPLLRKDLPELVKSCSDNSMGSIIETNALKLDARMARRLKEAGLNVASMSIDSTDAETHDRLRGVKGTFDAMMKAVDYCRKNGIVVHWSAYADKQKLNDGGLEAIIELAGKVGVKVRIITPIMAGKWLNAEEFNLNRRDIMKLRALLDPEVAFWEQETCSNPRAPFRCISRDKEFFYITAYGDVTPCCYVPLSFGNVRSEKLVSILKRMWKHDMYELPQSEGCIMNEKAFRDRYLEEMRVAPCHPIFVR